MGGGTHILAISVVPIWRSYASPSFRIFASRTVGARFDMWYVVQVITGREQRTAERISQVIPREIMHECFFPQYTTEIKVKGRWVAVDKPLFPGYLIAVTDEPYTLDRGLRRFNFSARLVSQGKTLQPLDRGDVHVIDSCTEPGHRVVPMSRGFKDGDAVSINQGPLVGQQARIKRINRRKSTALVEFNLCGRIVTARMGLALISADCVALR